MFIHTKHCYKCFGIHPKIEQLIEVNTVDSNQGPVSRKDAPALVPPRAR